MKRLMQSLMLSALASLTVSSLLAAVPQQLSYQGRLTDAGGQPLNLAVNLTFNIYADSLGGSSLWSEVQPAVAVTNGLFSAILGSVNPIPASAFNGEVRWLGIQVGSDPELRPLRPLISVADAYRALNADTSGYAKTIADNSVTGAKIVSGAIQFSDIGQNSAASGEVMKWSGSAWTAEPDAVGSNTSGWTDGGAVVALTSSGDTVAINTSSRLGKFNLGGNLGLNFNSNIFFGNDTTLIKGYSGDDMALHCQDFFLRSRGSTYFGHPEDAVWMEIDNVGKRLGIGTTTPDDRLHVENDASGGTCWLKIHGSHATNWGQTGLRIQTPANTWHLRQDLAAHTNFPEGALSLYSSGSATEATTWLENGNVGIGTTNPGSHRLLIRGASSGTSGSTLYTETTSGTGVAASCYSNSSNPTLIASQKGTGDILRCYSVDASDVSTTIARITKAGRVICPVLELTGGSDVAEPFEMTDGDNLPEGSLVVIDAQNPGRLRLADSPYDTRVAGVISGAGGVNPGITLSQAGVTDAGQNVAISGRVYCLADAGYGAIKPGDLLTTSPTKGHAMVAADRERAYGTVIGKAMSALDSGTGLVLILVSLQ